MTQATPAEPDRNSAIQLSPELARAILPSTAAGPILAAAEFLILCLALYCGTLTYHWLFLPWHVPTDQLALSAGVLMAALYIVLSHPRGSFTFDEMRGVSLRGPLTCWCLAFMFFALASFSLKIGSLFSRGGIITGFLFGGAAIVALRSFVPATVRLAMQHRILDGRRVLVIADPGAAARLSPDTVIAAGFSPRGWLALPAAPEGGQGIERLASEAVQVARSRDVDDVLLVANAFRDPTVAGLLERLRVLPLRVLLVPIDKASAGTPVERRGNPVLKAVEVQSPPLSRAERLSKRWLDLAAGSALLVVLSPLLLAVAVMIKLDSRGPVLFRQTRIGYAGRPFQIFKFRSMYTMDDGAIVKQAERGDPRITRVGAFLRSTSLDELPQLFNVVLGQMSLVGPRPHARAHDQFYEPQISGYAWRHHALPGITGWAQVNGCRGETRTLASMEARIEHDLWYIRNWSFWLDVRILLRTVRAVMRSENAY